ncbi:SLC26A/SulP transporter family protein [Methylobacterium oryzihabitans]|uniref:Cyclic nucleotide-binding domain-containing protein n=1 Tax=Methylobacterium oryzihabitans TaxID=2499852 RepID=A0A437NXT9_9HYPH|nr:cyclic nucleotide-binding domain-containing protein [Methylobacterium oryzihabitans]RVU14846.1 cyclic nucleotide-binding domain-containing protein [Methylobacterium oryzihabitans]
MSTGVSSAPAGVSRRAAGAGWGLRTAVAALVVTILLVVELVGFMQLIYSGPLAPSRATGLSAMLLAFVSGSLVFAVIRRGVPVTHTFIGAAAVVQAAIAASVAERLAATGVTDPEVIAAGVLLACGLATLATSLVFLLLGTLRASLLAQLLPYPVLTGFLGGVGLLFVEGGVQSGAPHAGPLDLSAAADPGFLARLGLTLAVGLLTFGLSRHFRHWAVLPGVILATVAAVHGGLWWSGIGLPAAQAAGWLLDPFPSGSLLRLPAGLGGGFDPDVLVPLLPKILTQALVAVIIQILYVLSVELELQRDLDIDRTFVASGAANLLGSLFGSTAMGMGRTPTVLLHNLGGGNWLGWSLTVGAMAMLLVFGAAPLAMLPRPLAGGTLVFLGLNLLTALGGTLRTLPLWESVVALAVCAGTTAFGAASGFLIGIALAILIFAARYARIPAVRLAQTGAERTSSVIRAPEVARALREASRHTAIYTLQGYLFFLNAQAIYRRAGTEDDLCTLVLDFRDCVGLDSSALLVFRKMAQLARQRGFDLLLVHLAPEVEAQVRRSGLSALPHLRVADTLDHALRTAEDRLLARIGVAARPEAADFAGQIGRTLNCTVGAIDLTPYLAVETLGAGDTLVRQGEAADALYFVESGLVSIELEVAGRANLRLRTMAAGTVIGEVAMLQGGRRTATAVAETACRLGRLDRTALDRMERERPDLALVVQRFLIVELASKLFDTTRLLEAETR